MFASGGGTFNNAGTFTKQTAGTLDVNIPFNNDGTVNLQAGTINFASSGTGAGSFTAAAGTTLNLNSQTLQAGSSISAPTVNLTGTTTIAGTYNVTNATTVAGTSTFTGNVQSVGQTLTVTGTATFNSNAVTAQTITFSGTINGSAEVSPTATGTFNFNGNLGGTGVTNIATGATLNIGGSQPALLRTVNNAGTANYAPGNSMIFSNGVFNNLAGATFNANTEAQLFQSGGTNAFNNAGTINKSTGTGELPFNVPFNNSNVVNLQTGTLNFNTSGTSTGTFTGAAGTLFKFSNHNLQAGSTINAPAVEFTQTNTVAGTYNVTSTTTISPGTTTFTGNVTNLGTTLDIAGPRQLQLERRDCGHDQSQRSTRRLGRVQRRGRRHVQLPRHDGRRRSNQRARRRDAQHRRLAASPQSHHQQRGHDQLPDDQQLHLYQRHVQ